MKYKINQLIIDQAGLEQITPFEIIHFTNFCINNNYSIEYNIMFSSGIYGLFLVQGTVIVANKPDIFDFTHGDSNIIITNSVSYTIRLFCIKRNSKVL